MLCQTAPAGRATPAGTPSSARSRARTYARHDPQRTLLYALVQAHYPDFLAQLAAQDRPLPAYVREAFEAYLRCGVLEHGFLRVVCEQCHAERLVAFSCKQRGFCPSCGARRMAESARHLADDVFGARPVRQWVLSVPFPLRWLFASKPDAIGPLLAIVQRVIGGWLADQAGIERASAQCGAVSLIQRFGSALNLNVHFHMLLLDGVYEPVAARPDKPHLRRARAPSPADLTALAGAIAHRVCRHLARAGWLEGEGDSAHLSDRAGSDDAMDALRMRSITYRIATGKHAGRKVATLQTLPADADAVHGDDGQVGGFSLHAGVAAQAHERDKLERLCRYIARPAIAERRLSISPQGRVRYELKSPWRNGTTHVEFEPIDFIAKLAALVPLNDLGPMPQARVRHRRGDLRPVAVQCGSWPASKSPRRSAPS